MPSQRDARCAFQDSVAAWRPLTVEVLLEAGVQLRQEGGQFAVRPGVGRRPLGGLEESSPAVAEGGVPELGQLLLVGDAPSQSVLGSPLPLWVTQR
jgi:hypothetical protein